MSKEKKTQGKNKKVKKSTQPSDVSTVQFAENNLTVQDFSDEQTRYVGDYDRLRGFALELYASPEHWGTLLEVAEHYAYIYHDRDKKEDGSPKTPHYHLLVRFKNAKTKSAVRKLTELDKLTKDFTLNFQKLIDTKGAFSYLTHTTKKAIKDGKTVYPLDEVKCDKLSYWQYVSSAGTLENEDFIADLCYNRLSRKELGIKYGRDYMKNMARYNDFKEQVLFEDSREKLLANQKELIEALGSDNEVPIETLTDVNVNELRTILIDYLADVIIQEYRFNREHDIYCSASFVAEDYLKDLCAEIHNKINYKLTKGC